MAISDIDDLDIGFILDMFTIKINDIAEPDPVEATQEYYDNF